jgi:hypothetical protein
VHNITTDAFILFKCYKITFSLQLSKRRAAEQMLESLKQLAPIVSATLPKPRKPVAPKKKTRNLIKVIQAGFFSQKSGEGDGTIPVQ